MKKTFSIPFILPLEGGEGGDVIGGGTGQGGVPPTDPISYDAWLNSQYASDLQGDGSTNEIDYGMWWQSMMELDPNGFSQTVWETLNPTLDFEEYVLP